VAIEEIKVLLQHILSVNPIFVVICEPKQPLQNCLSKASFMLFMFFKSTKWKHVGSTHIFFPLKPEQFSRMLSQFSPQGKAETHRARFDNAARFFSFLKLIKQGPVV
jgi:hypothetical protein